MASIVKRKKKYSVVYYKRKEDGTKKQVWESFPDLESAVRRKDQIEYLQRYGCEKAPNIITVKDLMQEYLAVYGVNNWAMSTYTTKSGLIDHYINPTLGHLRLMDLNPRQMDRYYQSLSQVRVVSTKYNRASTEFITEYTIHEIWKILRQAFDQAVRWGIMEKNPALGVKNKWKKRGQREMWTAEEFFFAVGHCKDPLLALAMHLAFACTMRLGEILGLRWKDVHISQEDKDKGIQRIYVKCELTRVNRDVMERLGERDVLFRFPVLIKGTQTQLILKTPKSESSIRMVYLPETVAKMLCARKAVVQEEQLVFERDYTDYGLVFCNSIGRPIESSVIERSFSALIRRNELKTVVFHSLRHTSITYKLKLTGGDMKAVQGDAGLRMIEDVYAHIMDEDRVKTAEIMEKTFYSRMDSENENMITGDQETENNMKKEEEARLRELLQDPETIALLRVLLRESGRFVSH